MFRRRLAEIDYARKMAARGPYWIRKMVARDALRSLDAVLKSGPDQVELVGQLLAGLREEAEQIGGPQLWDDAIAVMRRIQGETGSQ